MKFEYHHNQVCILVHVSRLVLLPSHSFFCTHPLYTKKQKSTPKKQYKRGFVFSDSTESRSEIETKIKDQESNIHCMKVSGYIADTFRADGKMTTTHIR